jgi:ATP/maltotriose-dependent transcriptional regulator MalT/DNA-binding SARP family transcriptional activator
MRDAPAVAKVARPKLVDIQPRKRLYTRLDALRRAHAVPWIVAPAGSGKTVLVVSYVDDRRLPTLWYRVDEGDRDAEDLFFYLRLAAERFEGSRRARVELPSFSPGSELSHFSRRFFEALFARLPPSALLVFDDYHLAPEGSPWQAAVEKGLRCVPPGMNVIVVSRRSPPATFARPLVHGDVGLLEAADLLLTREETVTLGKRRTLRGSPRLHRADLEAIHAFTGGWAAGISLLLRRDRQLGAPPLHPDADVQPIFDYLANAVFSELTDDAQRVLLHTACLQRFTAKQATELSGVTGARAVLRALFRSGFFLECDDTGAEEFRCHPLFHSFLRYRAGETLTPEAWRATRARAARLLREEGRGEDALEVLLQIDDRTGLGELVLDLAPELFAQGRLALLDRWLEAIPGDLLEASTWLTYWRAMCLLMIDPTKSRTGFERALDRFEEEQDCAGAYLAWAGAVQALTYEGRAWHEVERWLSHLVRIEARFSALPSADVGSQVATALLMGLTLTAADPETVERWAARALSLTERARDPTIVVMTASALLLNYALQGDSGHAAVLVAKLEEESRRGRADLLARVAARAATTALAWHQGDAAASLAAARDGLALMGDRRIPMWPSALLVFGSCAALDLGDLPEVQRFLERLAEIAESGTPLDVSAYHVVRAYEALARRDLSTAMVAIELSLDRDRAVGFAYAHGKDLQVLAYIAFELGDADRGREVLEAARRIEEEYPNPVLPYWRLLIEAEVALGLGDRGRTRELLGEAFAVGRERQVYSSYWHGTPAVRLASLCAVALEEGIEPEYTRTLVRRRLRGVPPPRLDVPGWPWPIRVHTLRRVEIVVDDAPVALGRARTPPLMLKAIVALSVGGRSVAVPKILATLWPDAEGDAAMQVFEVTLLRLRRQLGPEGHRALRLDGGHLSLDRGICWTDVDALDALLKEITARERASPSADATELRSYAERLLAHHGGPFAGSRDLPPALIACDDRLRSRVTTALSALCRELERLGDAASAEAVYLKALEGDPGMEALLAPAVRCMIGRGHRQEARALVDLCQHEGARSEEAEALLFASIGGTAARARPQR